MPTNATAASATFHSSMPSSLHHLPSLRSISNFKSLQRSLTALPGGVGGEKRVVSLDGARDVLVLVRVPAEVVVLLPVCVAELEVCRPEQRLVLVDRVGRAVD
eukprot:4078702-Prymnesium_polylepis.1